MHQNPLPLLKLKRETRTYLDGFTRNWKKEKGGLHSPPVLDRAALVRW